jgi:hypothetical protein
MPSLQWHSALPIVFNRCKYEQIFPWPVMFVVTFRLKFKFTASLLSTLGKNYLVIVPFFVSSHCRFHFPMLSFLMAFFMAHLGILPYPLLLIGSF